jgi:hypothetical protein
MALPIVKADRFNMLEPLESPGKARRGILTSGVKYQG